MTFKNLFIHIENCSKIEKCRAKYDQGSYLIAGLLVSGSLWQNWITFRKHGPLRQIALGCLTPFLTFLAFSLTFGMNGTQDNLDDANIRAKSLLLLATCLTGAFQFVDVTIDQFINYRRMSMSVSLVLAVIFSVAVAHVEQDLSTFSHEVFHLPGLVFGSLLGVIVGSNIVCDKVKKAYQDIKAKRQLRDWWMSFPLDGYP